MTRSISNVIVDVPVMIEPAVFVPVTVMGVVIVKLTREVGVPAIGETVTALTVLGPELFTPVTVATVSSEKSTVRVVLRLCCCKHASNTRFTSMHVFSHALLPEQHNAEELEFLQLQVIINLPFIRICFILCAIFEKMCQALSEILLNIKKKYVTMSV